MFGDRLPSHHHPVPGACFGWETRYRTCWCCEDDGVLKLTTSFKFVVYMALYRDIVEQVADLSLLFQKDTLLMSAVQIAVSAAQASLGRMEGNPGTFFRSLLASINEEGTSVLFHGTYITIGPQNLTAFERENSIIHCLQKLEKKAATKFIFHIWSQPQTPLYHQIQLLCLPVEEVSRYFINCLQKLEKKAATKFIFHVWSQPQTPLYHQLLCLPVEEVSRYFIHCLQKLEKKAATKFIFHVWSQPQTPLYHQTCGKSIQIFHSLSSETREESCYQVHLPGLISTSQCFLSTNSWAPVRVHCLTLLYMYMWSTNEYVISLFSKCTNFIFSFSFVSFKKWLKGVYMYTNSNWGEPSLLTQCCHSSSSLTM